MSDHLVYITEDIVLSSNETTDASLLLFHFNCDTVARCDKKKKSNNVKGFEKAPSTYIWGINIEFTVCKRELFKNNEDGWRFS